jgi:peptide/nickel transport system ATP-binding protein
MTGAGEPLLEVRHLAVAYRQGGAWLRVVDDVSFAVSRGEAFGLVGESGCGKSTVALQILGYRHPAMRAEAGSVNFDGHDLLALSRPELDRLRGSRVSFVPQNPTTALNPAIRVGRQIAETLEAHGRNGRPTSALAEAGRLLALVGLPGDAEFLRRYPHQLSGGQQQRICIAMALACDPALLVLDEPTTGLDVTTQEQIVSLLIDLRARIGLSMVYVTHDLGLLSQIADRIGVMYAGRMVEIAPTAAIFTAPRHPYTQGLIGSIPRIEEDASVPARLLQGLLRRPDLPPGCPFQPRCGFAAEACARERQELEPAGENRSVACRRWREIPPPALVPALRTAAPARSQEKPLLALAGMSVAYGSAARRVLAVREASFSIAPGEVLALVGESGSGKSTIARAVSGLVAPTAGTITLSGERLAGDVRHRTDGQRRLVQYVFQNPDSSLNPRARVGAAIARPLEHFFRLGGEEARARVARALADVQLDASYAARFPDELSGGERQRVAIARALAAEPALLLCDEVLSALDVSVQANILTLLQRLKAEHSIAMLFISHDLAVVRMLADRICVLYGGEVMELGPRERVFSAPFHPYTHSLLHAVPVPLERPAAASARPKLGEPRRGGQGCPYAGRCPWQPGDVCDTERPPWREAGGGLGLRCHLSLPELESRATWPRRAVVEPVKASRRKAK